MHSPPDLEMRSPAAANGRANRKEAIEPHDIAETAADRQERFLRRRFALGYYLAAAVAQLAWAVQR